MAQLTSQQANELANNYLIMAKTVGDYWYQNFDSLPKPESQKIQDLHLEVLKYANDFFTLSANLVMDDVQLSLSSIGEVTNQMKSTYNTLKDFGKAINIAAAVVTLGESILNKNPKDFASSLGTLFDTLQS